jgi:aerobic carbon-monoxide dehydrogenase medium subunit
MKPAQFDWHPARSLDEAVALLAQYAPHDGRVIAGGQSLVPSMALRLAFPAHLIDINGVADLATARVDAEADVLSIGACVRHAACERRVEPGVLGRLLSHVVHHIAHGPIRARGTFCGSLANADPASEWCLVAATLEATMIARSTRGVRRIAARDWFQGIMTTALAEDELLAEVQLPRLGADARFGFHEFSRRAGDYALSMSLAVFRLIDGRLHDVRIGVGGVESQPRRIAQAEAVLEGQSPSPELFSAAAAAAAAAVDPLEDARTRAGYRRELVATSVRRALAAAVAD